MDMNSLAHTKWECKYHLVFAPKYRRQIIYGKIKADVGQILSILCKRKELTNPSVPSPCSRIGNDRFKRRNGNSRAGAKASSANPGPFTIKLNSRTINRDATNFSNFVKSVLVHEYGHIFCLDHTARTSIMNNSRDRNTMTTPQQFDIDEVNSVYK